MRRILHLDDDLKLRENTKAVLTRHQFIVDSAATADEAIKFTSKFQYAVILLDIVMPGKDGFYVLKTLRAAGNLSGIFMLSGQSGEKEKVHALNSGADDYITKPYFISELIARIERWIDRHATLLSAASNETIHVANLSLEVKRHRAIRDGKAIALSAKQTGILFFLMKHPNQVFTPFEILEEVWNEDFDGLANTVEFHIKNLRAKIDRGFPVEMIKTVRGSGYRLEAPAHS